MNYKQAIEIITKRRQQQLIDADAIYYNLLDNKEFYDIEKQIKIARLDNIKSNSNGKENKNLVSLLEKKAKIMAKLNITSETLSPSPYCKLCNDTGLINGKPCKCVVVLATNLSHKTSNGMLDKIKFSDFRLDIYDDDIRLQMEKLKATMQIFCFKFPYTNYRNIVLMGSVGVGKSYLSACVASELKNRNESVIMCSAFNFTNDMLKYHTTFDNAKLSFLTPYIDCSLLVLDDLGTESILKNITLEYLYLVINERILNNKHTIITTNLSMDEINNRYGSRICSRIFDKKIAFVQQIIAKDLRIIQ